MSIFSKTKNKNVDELFIVFDIGSSSVGGAVFRVKENKMPEIIFTVRETITLRQKIDIDQFLTSTMKSLDIVAGRVHRAGVGAPAKIFCVLSSPWHVSQTRVISLKKNTSFVFTTKLADELIKKEISILKDEHAKEYSYEDNSVRPIELKSIKTMLNGYETQNPLDKKAKEIEMTVFISISPEQVLQKIEETVMHHFHFKEIKFSSFAMTSFAVVRDIYTKSEDFLLINIDGETTDISMVKKNALRESASFPLGINFIIRGIASKSRLSLGEAKSYISLLKNGHAGVSLVKKITLIIDELKTEWLKKFQESLANLSNDISVPATIYLAVDKEMADFFLETIKTEQFNQYTLTESKFKIIVLGDEVLHGLVKFKNDAVRDAFLGVDSIYISRFLLDSSFKS